MRTLSATLLAAQRSLGGVPSVRARIEDHELRWAPLLDDDSSTRLSAAWPVAGAILRARINESGTLDVQRITSPSTAAQWQSWAVVATGAAAASDVALSTAEGSPERVRLFFVRPDGGVYRISWLQSADAGQTWSGVYDLVSGLTAAAIGLASANAQLLYHDPADGYLKLAVRGGWEAGSWTVSPWTAAGALAARYGLAAGFSGGTYYVASSDEESAGVRRLRTGTHVAATGAWTAPVAIVPPGIPAAAFAPTYPSLAYVDGLWHLAYLETFTGILAYAEPTVVHSPDWEHWSFACWVPLEAFGSKKRAVLIHHEQVLYLAMECAVWRAAAYSPADPDKHLATSDVLGYVVEEEAWQGRTLVELYNPGGRYSSFGQDGQAGAAIKPLARLALERGFRTTAGEERVDRPPYYVVCAAVRRGGSRPALYLECEDGWGLLRRWRPDALYAWSGKTIAWLIAEVLYRAAGLSCAFDGASGWDTVLESFAITPGNWDEALDDRGRAWLRRETRAGGRGPATGETLRCTGLGAVRTLLAKVSGRARWQADGTLFCFIPWAQALTNPYAVGTGGEILDALYGRGLMIPTQARVFGEGVAAVAAAPGARGYPRRYLATYVDPHLDQAQACGGRASGLVHDGQACGHLAWVETPCQCGLDLYDLLVVDDPHAGGLQSEYLRAAGIVERYSPSDGLFVTRVILEGA